MVDIQAPEGEEQELPERLGRYRLVRRISRGGMAQVYEARRESLAGVAPRVALKVILPEHASDPNFRDLFINEARVGSQLQHPNLVQIQDFDQQADLYYLVMEFVEGTTFRRFISLCKRNGVQMPLPIVAELGRQVCEGLHYAHTACAEDGSPRHLVHRDIKPGNLILNPQGVVKVLDFGISKVLTVAEGTDGVKGTWGYMSPEQAMGRPISGLADLYGMAAVLYELVTLTRLFGERDQKRIREMMLQDEGARAAASLSGPYRDLGPVLVRALQRDSVARYNSAQDMARALERLVGDPTVVRERLVAFQSKMARMDKSRAQAPAPEGQRSQSTLSKGRIEQPYKAGIPVSVGNAHRPMQPAEIRPGASPKKRTTDTRSTLGLAVLGATILALAVVLFQIFGQAESRDVPELPPEEVVQKPVVETDPVVEVSTEEEAEPEEEPTPEPPPPATTPRPTTTRPRTPAPDTSQSSADPVVGQSQATGTVTISSLPRSRVSIDDSFVRHTPLLAHELSAGTHLVQLETDDGRTVSFRITVEPGENRKRIWDFELSQWADQ